MSRHAFDKIKQGLDEVRAFLDGTADKSRYRVRTRTRKPTLDEMGPGVEAIPSRATGPRSTLGKPEMRGGWKPRGRQ